jgi:hypothetical protein
MIPPYRALLSLHDFDNSTEQRDLLRAWLIDVAKELGKKKNVYAKRATFRLMRGKKD